MLESVDVIASSLCQHSTMGVCNQQQAGSVVPKPLSELPNVLCAATNPLRPLQHKHSCSSYFDPAVVSRMEKVGWIFTQSSKERDYIMNSEEICQMAAWQDEAGEHCVTGVVSLAMTEEGSDVHFEAFQVRWAYQAFHPVFDHVYEHQLCCSAVCCVCMDWVRSSCFSGMWCDCALLGFVAAHCS